MSSVSASDPRTIMTTEEASYDNIEEEDVGVEEEKPEGGCSKGRKKMALNLLLVSSYVAVGVIVMMMNGWGFITSLYVITQIVTTIGYGDITMEGKDWMYVFMSFYVLVGIVFVANVINDVGDALLDKEAGSMRAHLLKMKHGVKSGQKHVPSFGERYKLWALSVAIAIFFFFVITWMIFFATYESCSCSYGVSAVKDCDASNCTSSGAQTKSWCQAFYMAIITMTTVGFGDFTPQSELGRAAGSLWMFFGVLATVNMVGAIGATMTAIQKGGHGNKIKMTEDVFAQMDIDKSGKISKAEFQQYVLLKEGIVTQETLDGIKDLFDELDKDGSGGLTVEDLENEFDDDE